MNPVLTKLGVPAIVQQFFNLEELLFDYGGDFEHYDTGFHRVPVTENIWLAGKDLSRDVIIAHSAMETIAYLSLNLHRYPDLNTLSLIAIGNLPQPSQLQWIKKQYPKSKYTLVFGRELLGKLADIRVAAGLKNKTLRMQLADNQILIYCDHEIVAFDKDAVSLNAFEKAAGLRTKCRTAKPKEFNMYLDQLKHHANQ